MDYIAAHWSAAVAKARNAALDWPVGSDAFEKISYANIPLSALPGIGQLLFASGPCERLYA